MQALHVGNIANMAYSYCDILGTDECLNYDLDHPCSLPENALRSTKSIPNWYRIIHSKEDIQNLDTNSEKEWINFLNNELGLFNCTTLLKNNLQIERFLYPYLKNFDLLFGYSYSAIPLMIHAEKPFIPIEIGNLRDINYKNDAFSQLFLKACLTAPHVIITNPDTKESAEKAGIKCYTFIPHPVNESLWKKKNRLFLPSYIKEARNSCEILMISPARHDYIEKGNDKVIKAFERFLKINNKSKIILIEWGNDLEKSKAYIKENSLENYVIWLPLLSETELLNWFSVSDILLDQFGIPKTFGLLTAKGMAAALPVITNYDYLVNEWAFPEKPPIINAFTEDEIFYNLKHCATNKRFIELKQKESIAWIDKYHSKKVISEKFNEVEKIISNKMGNWETYLKLKRAKRHFQEKFKIKKEAITMRNKLIKNMEWKILQDLSEQYPEFSKKELLEALE